MISTRNSGKIKGLVKAEGGSLFEKKRKKNPGMKGKKGIREQPK